MQTRSDAKSAEIAEVHRTLQWETHLSALTSSSHVSWSMDTHLPQRRRSEDLREDMSARARARTSTDTTQMCDGLMDDSQSVTQCSAPLLQLLSIL